MTYSLDRFADAELELLRLQLQMEVMRRFELPVFEALGLEPCKLLDVGVGSGAYANELSRLGFNVTGIDSDPMLLDAASERAAFECIRARAEAMPFADQSFDATFARLVFQHLPNPLAVLQEMLRVTKVHGVVLVVDTDLQPLVVHPDIPTWGRARDAWIAQATRAHRDPFVGRKLKTIMQNAAAAAIQTHTITMTSDQIGADAFAEMLLIPYANWFGDQQAILDVRRWATDPGAFGMASLIVCKGQRGT